MGDLQRPPRATVLFGHNLALSHQVAGEADIDDQGTEIDVGPAPQKSSNSTRTGSDVWWAV